MSLKPNQYLKDAKVKLKRESVRPEGCGEYVPVRWYTTSKQSGRVERERRVVKALLTGFSGGGGPKRNRRAGAPKKGRIGNGGLRGVTAGSIAGGGGLGGGGASLHPLDAPRFTLAYHYSD